MTDEQNDELGTKADIDASRAPDPKPAKTVNDNVVDVAENSAPIDASRAPAPPPEKK